MNNQTYTSTMDRLVSEYNRVPNDLGLMTYGKEYTLIPQQSVTGLQGNAEQQVSLYANPAAQLYQSGNTGLQMFQAGSSDCSKGCLAFHPDPRVERVKPLYSAHRFGFQDVKPHQLPNANNVMGMYH